MSGRFCIIYSGDKVGTKQIYNIVLTIPANIQLQGEKQTKQGVTIYRHNQVNKDTF